MTVTELPTDDLVDAAPGDAEPAELPVPDAASSTPDGPEGAPAAAADPEPADPAPALTRADLDVPLQALDGRLAAVDSRLTELADRLGATGGEISSTRARAEAVEAVTSGRVDAVEGSATAVATRLTAAESRLAATDKALKAEHQHAASLGGELASVGARLVGVHGRLDSLDDHVATLQHHVADHDRSLNELTRTIAAEVERHTSDALVDSRHSLQLAVNSIAHLALAMAESSRDLTDDVSAESATALLDSFRVDLDAILAQLGFESLGTTAGTTFDPHRHRALKRVPTSDPAQDRAITQVIRDGYQSAGTGRILLFADVEVSRYRP